MFYFEMLFSLLIDTFIDSSETSTVKWTLNSDNLQSQKVFYDFEIEQS